MLFHAKMLYSLPRIHRPLKPVWQFAYTVPSTTIRTPIADLQRFGGILKAPSAQKVVEGNAISDHLHPDPQYRRLLVGRLSAARDK
jgi:hypothetical protein